MTDNSIGIWFAADYDEDEINNGRCPECGEDEMDGARCHYCGFHDYNCEMPDCPWCRDSDEHPKGEDAERLSGEAMPARAEGIAQSPEPPKEPHHAN